MPGTRILRLSEILPAVVHIAQRAGAEVLDVYGTDFEARAKDDASPLTEADLRSHRLIVRELTALTPSIPVLSEESSDIDFATRSAWPEYWLVDPLDGTKEFVSRNGEFTVNIALIRGHRPVLGVVYIPVTDTVYAGVPGEAASRQDAARAAVAIQVRRKMRSPIQVLGSRSHGNPKLSDALNALGPHELRPAGSSIKLCLVADGSADLYPRLGPTSEWDIAAGQAVIEAAGGQVVRLSDGQALSYNSKESLLNPDFMAYGDPDCYRRWPRA
jgi:3'(2'), 5'-bisphosphate nucleotidase